MKKILILLIFFVKILFSADLNSTLINETNSTLYKNLIKSIDLKSEEGRLQKALITKILKIDSDKIKPFKIAKVKNQNDFINNFWDIIEALSNAKKFQENLSSLKDQLDSIKEDISNLDANATNLLTLELEYAYYYKKYQKLKSDIQNIDNSYKSWIDSLLKNLKDIEFNANNLNKKIKYLDKKISYIDKKIKKLSIEKERWKVLNQKIYVKNLEKEIDRLQSLKDYYLKKEIKLELISFFKAAKSKSEDVFKIKENILQTASKLSDNAIKESLDEVLNITISKTVGIKLALFYQLKSTTLTFFVTNRVFGVPFYKIVFAIAIFLLFLVLRKLFVLIVLKSLQKIASKTKTKIDDAFLKIVDNPLKFAFIILGFYLAILVMDIENEALFKIVKSLVIFDIFWLFYESVEAMQKPIYNFAKRFGHELYKEIGSFFIKTLKIFIFSVGLVAILQEWSINVSAFLASLGLGGLAFALAAKDTAANLFGGLTILADRSLKIGDWIKVGSVEGDVEDIGLRSIKVRTFEKSLITLPNQIVANNPIENFSRRDIRRIKTRIGLTYSTTKEQLQNILNDIKNMLKSHPKIDKKATMIVNFDEFEDSSLSIFIYCFTNTAVWTEYLQIREDINLKIMDIVQKHKAEFAFPSQSIYVEKLKGLSNNYMHS